MNRAAVVTGAGSGVGQAIALALARENWRVALVGRRLEALQSTVRQGADVSANLLAFPCDISDAVAVAAVANQILENFKSVEVLVNAAGTNTPKRSLQELSLEDYHRLMDTNLNGAYYCAQAFLPGMRKQQCGTIVNVVSDSAKQASAKAGPAYAISKFGLAGLTQAINAEERNGGIRACSVFPGDIDTPLLNLRPAPPPPEARQKMLLSEDVAECIMLAIRLSARAIVEEILIRPR